MLIAVFNPLVWKETGRKQVWRVCFPPWPTTSYLSNMKRKIGRRMGWQKITIFPKFMGLPYTDLSGRVPLHRPYHITWQPFYIMVLLNMKIKPYFNSISIIYEYIIVVLYKWNSSVNFKQWKEHYICYNKVITLHWYKLQLLSLLLNLIFHVPVFPPLLANEL